MTLTQVHNILLQLRLVSTRQTGGLSLTHLLSLTHPSLTHPSVTHLSVSLAQLRLVRTRQTRRRLQGLLNDLRSVERLTQVAH